MTDEERAKAADRPNTFARLRAVVAIDFAHRVRCQQPGCGHSVHAAVHVVEEAGELLVLGSTCFAKRYGSAGALGPPQYGGGSGRKLTDEERILLAENTQALLASFEAEEAALEARAQAQAVADQKEREAGRIHAQEVAPQPGSALTRSSGLPALGLGPSSPWSWQLPGTSVALLEAPDGAKWVRVQHRDGSQKLVPWPRFPGWETALPSAVGKANPALGAVEAPDIVLAITLMRQSGYRGPVIGRWSDVLKPTLRRAART